MCTILKTNFEEKYSEIVQHLKEASFISIDCEFTGLLSDETFKSSLFDTPAERYDKVRKSSELFRIVQLGVSTFKFQNDANNYAASSYTFYLFPRAFSSIDKKILLQSSSVEFLCNYKFDFNKLFYEGISYLNKADDAQLRQDLHQKTFFHGVERNLSYYDESVIQDNCSRIADWAASASEPSCVVDVGDASAVISYFIHQEVRGRFPSLWTFQQDQCHITVKRVSESERKSLQMESEKNSELETFVYNYLLGFSRLFDVISSLRKPIIGHNILLDLMMIYKEFIGPLPVSYNKFKVKINEVFPIVFDTKYLSYQFRNNLKKEDSWTSNSLNGLHEYFATGKGSTLVLFQPSVILNDGFAFKDVSFHEAGYDSYVTGLCFANLAHCELSWNPVSKTYVTRSLPATFTEYLSALSRLKNRVNVIRGTVNHIRLDHADPVSERPPLLHIQSKTLHAIDIDKVAQLVAKYGLVDIRPCTRHRALIAVGNHSSAKDILQLFSNHRDLAVSPYSVLRHSPVARVAMWGGLVASSALCALLIFKHIHKPRLSPT